eukprot:756966-Hanusia_phi.AAC.1
MKLNSSALVPRIRQLLTECNVNSWQAVMHNLVLLQNLQNKARIPEVDEEQLSNMFIKRLLQSPCDPVHRCANALDVDARNRGKRPNNSVTRTADESSSQSTFVTFDEIQTCFDTEDIRQFSTPAG